jgi:hypothetical protein
MINAYNNLLRKRGGREHLGDPEGNWNMDPKERV